MWQVKSNSSQKWFYQDGDEFNNPVLMKINGCLVCLGELFL
jgi:hypothetical protein